MLDSAFAIRPHTHGSVQYAGSRSSTPRTTQRSTSTHPEATQAVRIHLTQHTRTIHCA